MKLIDWKPSYVNHAEKRIIIDEKPKWGKIMDISVPEKGGVRYLVDGTFIGFLEP